MNNTEFSNMNKYIEKRLELSEANNLQKKINNSSKIKQEYDELNNVFNLLNNYGVLNAPVNLADNIMLAINSTKSPINTNFILKTFAKSLVAAGLLITILSFIPPEYLTSSSFQLNFMAEINQYIIDPITNIFHYLYR